MSKLVTAELRANYVVEVTLHYLPKRVNIRGNINLYKKGGEYGRSDSVLDMCSEMGCLGVFTDSFQLTEVELEEIIKGGNPNIEFWPESAKNRYDNWGAMLVTCPKCKVISRRNTLSDAYGFNTTLNKIALAVTGYFRELDSNADIVLKVHRAPGSLQTAKQDFLSTGNKGKYAEDLEKARLNHHVFYPLAKLLKDTAGGASVESCIERFLRA
jgi:hypothetical protein